MTRLVWLKVFTLSILSCGQLIADEHQDSRHFNVNPGNMMNGMMNPMQNMFGDSNRNNGAYNDYYYNDYPYYPAQAYPTYPPEYGYPGAVYGQPPAGYGSAPPAAYYQTPPGYPSQPQAAPPSQPYSEPVRQNRYRPPVETSTATPGYPSPTQERFQFRPLENQPPALEGNQYAPAPNQAYVPTPSAGAEAISPGNTQPVPLAPLTYPSEYHQQQPANAAPYTTNPPTSPSASYAPQTETAEPTMKFRPLDQPGYSQ